MWESQYYRRELQRFNIHSLPINIIGVRLSPIAFLSIVLMSCGAQSPEPSHGVPIKNLIGTENQKSIWGMEQDIYHERVTDGSRFRIELGPLGSTNTVKTAVFYVDSGRAIPFEYDVALVPFSGGYQMNGEKMQPYNCDYLFGLPVSPYRNSTKINVKVSETGVMHFYLSAFVCPTKTQGRWETSADYVLYRYR